MSKKLVLAFVLAVASGSSVNAATVWENIKGAVEKVVNVVDKVVDAPANLVFAKGSKLAGATHEGVSYGARLGVTAYLAHRIAKQEKVRVFLNKVTAGRCCKKK